MRDVLDAVTADASAADSRRQQMRERFPDFAMVMDSLGECGRMRHITVDGVTVAGKEPAPDNTVAISAGFYLMACNLGAKR